MTKLPNMFHHDSQEEAGLEVHQFWPLVEISCSDDLRFFLCSMYTPICIPDYHKSLPACRSVCNRAKAGCAPIMTQYGFAWPDRMSCDDLPLFGDPDHLCMDAKNGEEPPDTEFGGPVSVGHAIPPNSGPFMPDSNKHHNHQGTSGPKTTKEPKGSKSSSVNSNNSNKQKGGNDHLSSSSPTKTSSSSSSSSSGANNNRNVNNNGNTNGNSNPIGVKSLPGAKEPPEGISDCMSSCECRPPLIKLDDPMMLNDRRYYNRVETGGLMNCGQPCHSMYFKQNDQEEAFFLIVIFAASCLISCLVTVLTFLMDSDRFKYPERSIIFLCGCYLMISIGFLVRYSVGHDETACDGQLIRYQGTGPGPSSCVIVFILIYFFWMAANVWWLILCFTWFLAAGLKWGSEAIASYSQYFHLLALLVPTIKSLFVLGTGAVDGDPFTGICLVGNLDLDNLKKFILMPLITYLAVGGIFLMTGFISLMKIRKVIRQQASSRAKTNRLEKLMIRIIIFSILYVILSSVVIFCYYYEYNERKSWESQFTCPSCHSNTSSSRFYFNRSNSNKSHQSQLQQHPMYWLFVMKYVGCLVIGITSGFWIWSWKTLDSWSSFLCRICGCGSKSRKSTFPRPTYHQTSRGNGSIINGGSVNNMTINGGNGTSTGGPGSTPFHALHDSSSLIHGSGSHRESSVTHNSYYHAAKSGAERIGMRPAQIFL